MADTTDYRTKVEILADVWMDYRDDEGFAELIQFADLGFPLAYAIDNGIVENSDQAEGLIQQTFELLIKLLDIQDTGFENMNDMFDVAEQKRKPK